MAHSLLLYRNRIPAVTGLEQQASLAGRNGSTATIIMPKAAAAYKAAWQPDISKATRLNLAAAIG